MSSSSTNNSYQPISLDNLKIYILNVPENLTYKDIFLSVIYLNENERNILFNNNDILNKFKYISTLLNNDEKIELLKYIKELKAKNSNIVNCNNNKNMLQTTETSENYIASDHEKMQFLNKYNNNKYMLNIDIKYWDDNDADISSSDNSDLFIYVIRQMMHAYGDISPANNSIYAAIVLKNYIYDLMKILSTSM